MLVSARVRLLFEHDSDRAVGVLNRRTKMTGNRTGNRILDAWNMILSLGVGSALTILKTDDDDDKEATLRVFSRAHIPSVLRHIMATKCVRYLQRRMDVANAGLPIGYQGRL